MRLLTKAEACREMRLSLSTLNRRIAAGEMAVKMEPRGRRHRVYVMLDDDPPGNGIATDSALAVARERIHGLEEQVALLQERLEQEQKRYDRLLEDVRTGKLPSPSQDQRRTWWQFWQWRPQGCRRPPLGQVQAAVLKTGRVTGLFQVPPPSLGPYLLPPEERGLCNPPGMPILSC